VRDPRALRRAVRGFLRGPGPALAGIVGPPVFWGVLTALGMVRPGYDPFRYEFSLLAVGAHGWAQAANFVTFGLLVVAFKGGLEGAIAAGRRWGAIHVLALAFGAGFVALAAFPTDRSPYAPSVHGTIHRAVAGALILLFPVACFVIARKARRLASWRAHAQFTVAAGVLTVLLLLAWGGAWGVLRPWLGLYERAVFAVPSVWMEVMAIQLMKVSAAGGDLVRERAGPPPGAG
jgi:hypothetical protein